MVFLTFWGGLGAVRRAPASPPNLAIVAKARGGVSQRGGGVYNELGGSNFARTRRRHGGVKSTYKGGGKAP